MKLLVLALLMLIPAWSKGSSHSSSTKHSVAKPKKAKSIKVKKPRKSKKV